MIVKVVSLLLSISLLLVGCSHVAQPSTTAWLKRGVKVTLPYPYMDKEVHKQQLLTATVGDRKESLMTAIDIKNGQIVLVGLSPIGIRLFKATYDGKTIIVEQSIHLPELPPANQVLADIMLSYWPLTSWQPLLPNGWTLVDIDNKRLLKDEDQQLIMEISYHLIGQDRVPIDISNHYFNYHINIQDMSE